MHDCSLYEVSASRPVSTFWGMTPSGSAIDKHACLSREISARPTQFDGAPHPCILLIGTDVSLRTTRAQIFQKEGFKTLCHSGGGAIEPAVLAQANIMLICRSLSTPDAISLSARVHSCFPNLPIIRMAGAGEGFDAHYHAIHRQIVPPGLLIAEVDRLIHLSERHEVHTAITLKNRENRGFVL